MNFHKNKPDMGGRQGNAGAEGSVEQTAARSSRGSGVMDMTQGKPVQLMLAFMIPMLIGNVFQQLYSMVDSMIVGRFVGADALAAVGATGSLNWMFFSLCNGLGNGVGLMGGLGFVFARPVLALLKTPDDIIDMSAGYMQIMCVGVIAVALYNCISAILRGLGDSRTPLYFLIVASVLNVALDLLFVRTFHWGVAGAGVATIISQLLSGIGSLLFSLRRNPLFRLTREAFLPDRNIIWKAVRIGVPMAAQSSLIAFSCVILQSVVNSFGSTVVAAFTATSRIEQLVQQPYQSLSMSISTFTGQNIGARKEDRVQQGVWKSFAMMLVFSCAMIPVMQFGGKAIVGLFVEDDAVIALGAHALRLTSLFYLPLGVIYVFRGLLNGAGDAAFSLINGVTECAGRILFPKPLTLIPQVGVWGIWLGTAFTWTLVAAVTYIRFRTGAWRPDRTHRRGTISGQEAC